MAQPLPEKKAALAAALAHAEAGRPVFPCAPSKAPLTRNGFKAASLDEQQIRDWWKRWPDALIGMPTGDASGYWVLDVDQHGIDGEDALRALEAEHGNLPDTIEVLTAGGGRHLYFLLPHDVVVRNTAGALGPGLDTRGDGGYVILPGSVLPDGRRYEWEAAGDPDEGARAVRAPDWLIEQIGARPAPAPSVAPATRGLFVDETVVRSALQALDPDCGYGDWLAVGMALHSTGADWAFSAWCAWSSLSDKYPGNDSMERKWNSFRVAGTGGVRIGSLFAMAKQAGWQRPVERIEGPIPPEPPDHVYDDGGPAPPMRNRPIIEIRDGELPRVVDEAQAALLAAEEPIYVHGNRMVRLGRVQDPLGPVQIERTPGSSVLFEVGPHWLVERLTRIADFRRFDKRSSEWRPTDCPRKVADTLLAREGEWRFPILTGFLECPSLTLDGRVIRERGYDQKSGLFLTSETVRLPPLEEVSAQHAQEAADRLAEIVCTFPFVTDSDRAGALSMMLTAVLRRILPTAPFGAISASTPGTGKSLLADVVSVIATGRRGSAMAIGNEHAELEKRVDAALLDGDPLVVIDNIDRAVRSDVLCQVATQTSKTVRVLGYSRKVEAPTNICWMMTGNNLTLLGDLTRRVVMVQLECEEERPEEREFDRDAIEYAKSVRDQAVHDCLTISLGYQHAGAPHVGIVPYGSFETWDRMVRRPLVWAGFPDPLSRARDLREEDHEFIAMRGLMEEMETLWQNQGKTAAEILAAARETSFFEGEAPRPVNPDLSAVIGMLLGEGARCNASALGYKLRAWQGRIIANRRITKARTRSHAVCWRVERVR